MHLILSFKPHSRADGARDDYVYRIITIVWIENKFILSQ